jgi:hypothetical protein
MTIDREAAAAGSARRTHATLREGTRQFLCGLGLEQADGLSRNEYRDLVLEWTREVGRAGDGAHSFPVESGGQNDPGGRIASSQTVAHSDLSLLVKMGVQFGLFGGAVHRLGTAKHHDLLKDNDSKNLQKQVNDLCGDLRPYASPWSLASASRMPCCVPRSGSASHPRWPRRRRPRSRTSASSGGRPWNRSARSA